MTMEQEDKNKLKSLLFEAKAIAYDDYLLDDSPFIAIYFDDLINVLNLWRNKQ